MRERRLDDTGKTLFTNARIIDPHSGSDIRGQLLVEKGKIVDFGQSLVTGTPENDVDVIDCKGHVLSPGLIDMRVFVGEPGAEHKETLGSASRAAAAGGVTTLICMPNTDPVIDDVALVDFIERRARDTAIVHVHPMAALTKGLEGKQMTEMGLLAEAGAVGFTEGNKSLVDAQIMRRAMTYAANFDALIAQHAEEPSLSSAGCMNEGELATRLGLPGVPPAAETIMVERDVRLLELTGARYHLSQISSVETLKIVERAKQSGHQLTCAVSAHHLALNENDVASYRTFFKTNPPLRREEDRMSLVAGLSARSIDVIVSSHDPQAPENKRLPFAQAAYGVVGLETLLAVALELYHDGHLALMDALRAVTSRPAEILGLPSGKLTNGAPADLVLIDLERPFVINAEELHSKTKNTPFDGHRFQGRVLKTFVDGITVFDSDQKELAA